MTITTPASQSIEIKPQDSSYRYSSLMGEDYAEIIIKVPEYTEVPVGSTISIEGKTYTLMQPQHVTKHSDRNYEITLRFEGTRAALRKYMFRDLYGSLKFSNTVKLSEHMDLITYNLNQREGGWSYSINEEDTERTITVSHNTIADTLEQIREAYKTEWDINSKHIAIGKIEHFKDNPLPLSYGKGNGFKSGVKRENNTSEQQIDVLFVQGGERNIDPSTYGSRFLKMPPEITFPYEGSNYQTGALGHSIFLQGKNTPGAVEGSLDLSEIYPKREGTVTTVTCVNPSKNFFDFTDSRIPSDLDFNNYLIAGEKPLIVFQSRELAGKEFEFSQYVHATRTFKVVPQQIDGETMPALIESGAFRIQPGDRYIVTNISMPAAYLRNDADKTGASWEMALQAAKFLSERSKPRFSFIGDLDNIWAAQIIEHQGSYIPRWDVIKPKIKVGSHVLFSDPSIESQGVVIRITGVKSLINKPSNTEIELSNVSGSTSLSSVLKKQENEKVNTKETNYRSIQFAKRGFSQAQETATALQNALLGIEGDIENLEGSLAAFSGSINPITVSTMQVLLGDPSLQFYFVNNTTTPQRVPHTVTYNNSTKQLTSPAGIIQHKTIGITDIKPARAASEYRYWSFNSATINMSGYDASRYYYLYAKCNKTNPSGAFIIEQDPKAMEDSTHYYLLMGILNSEHEAERNYVSLYGFTEILPGRITTDKLVSQDGQTYIDLQTGIISGIFKFLSGTNVETAIAEAMTAAGNAMTAAGNAQGYIDAILPQELAVLQNQIDGVVISWFFPYTPATNNYPANEWTTTALKDKHLGDTFSNTQEFIDNSTTPDAGKSWRWVKDAEVYKWTLIADSDAVKALLDAAKAQDTADGKRRVFVAPPASSDKYDVGDLWVNATHGSTYSNDLLRCKTAKASGVAFNIAHWERASKYTDDSAINSLEIGGENFYNGANLLSISSSGGSTPTILRNQDNGFDILSSNGGNLTEARISDVVKQNGYHVLTCWIKVASGSAAITIDICDTIAASITATTEWQKITGVVNVENYSESIYNFVDIHTSTHCTIHVKDFMFQRGNKSTSYKKSTEYLTEALQGSTDISGGLLATNVLLMKTLAGIITGGMSGLASDNIGMWTGGTYQQAIDALAKVIFRKDGSGQLAGGKILWDLAGALNVGNFKIEGGAIIGYSSNKQKIKFHTGNIDALSSLAGLITTDPVRYSVNEDEEFTNSIAAPFVYNFTANSIGEITVPANTQINLYFPSVSINPGTAGSVMSSSEFYRIKLGETLIGEYESSTPTVVLNAGGTYKIEFIADYRIEVEASATTSISVTTTTEGYLAYQIGVERFEIGQNGFYVFYSTTAYIYFRNDYGFEARFGNIGLRFITGQSNPQKMTGGVWSNL